MNKIIIKSGIRGLLAILTFASVVILAGCQQGQPVSQNQPGNKQITNVSSTLENHKETQNESAETPEHIAQEKAEYSQSQVQTTQSTASSIYRDYTPEGYQALKGKKPLVLFFYAPWCPLCRAQDKNITANLGDFPVSTNILKTDYDSETALKQEFGITIQTSFVVLDASGKVVTILHDPPLDELKSAITKSL